MKFKIRYADKIVGLLAIAAIVFLAFAIFMLGREQRWFAHDYYYTSTFDSASGMSVGMPIQYKGFTIGKIKHIELNDEDAVSVKFFVYDIYNSRVRDGAVVELFINPIGLGNQFFLYPGNGTDLIPEGSEIPSIASAEGRARVTAGLVTVPRRDDTISNVVAQVSPLLTRLNETLEHLNGAMGGRGSGPLAETLSNAASISGDLEANLDGILADVKGITASLEKAASNPNGAIPGLIDPDGTMFESIEASLNAIEGTLDNVESSSSIFKSQAPQIARLIEDLRLALEKGQDVLEALKNNPLLKGGIPERTRVDTSGTNSRNIEF